MKEGIADDQITVPWALTHFCILIHLAYVVIVNDREVDLRPNLAPTSSSMAVARKGKKRPTSAKERVQVED